MVDTETCQSRESAGVTNNIIDVQEPCVVHTVAFVNVLVTPVHLLL